MSGDARSIERRASSYQQHLPLQYEENSWNGPPSPAIYAGISTEIAKDGTVTLAMAFRDATYLLDFFQKTFKPSRTILSELGDFMINSLRNYSHTHTVKFIGLAMPHRIPDEYPTLRARLWAEVDVLPLIIDEGNREARDNKFILGHPEQKSFWNRTLDEQAESMARRCVRLFGPENIPLLQVGFRGLVEVDTGFRVCLTTLRDFEKTVSKKTWDAIEYYAKDIIHRRVKIAFFSATPQGGGVALMRHALVRFSHALGTDVKWYVPKPRPGVFRVTKTNHNILQGVQHEGERLTEENWAHVTDWIHENANRPVIFRSHISIHTDLISQPGSPQEEAWNRMWQQIKDADIFISHPVRTFVPQNVPRQTVGYMAPSTDWLDGLNKNMRDWDVAFYGRVFNGICRNSAMTTINYPEDEYITQIARFDPSKGIPEVVESYVKFHERFTMALPDKKPPKLLICGHGSIDDPDGTSIHDAVVSHVRENLPHLADYICVARLGPSDQVLNALLSKAKVVLQLSTHEGFEVKVSEAIHKGKPVIATKVGGIPLQVAAGRNGFLVEVGDTDAVAQHLFDLITNDKLYNEMHQFAVQHVCDEVSTVGNMLNWLYLASRLSKGERIKPNEQWINDMARASAGQEYAPGENRLNRALDPEKVVK
ncbi:hypothetical protein N7517_009991 [Penicillium concentricum]|uniref:Glycosyl transferase family 1 domain-containing protein n=1 Tax=Penicillium concentricum TaxID=293559 RepID=A0A9W9RIF1_9EURO|nr:uncharacterized protein N7517_009991 [Penicillium concentricum]KAJ5360800.1 hypothetical protein N7517_009991 [Penicillium concentricum]